MKLKREVPSKKGMPWPSKEAMEQVYEMNLWGGETYDFYSGSGSYDPELVLPYIDAVTSFLTSFESPITVCDLGCGDFNVGKELVRHTYKYEGVDIVGNLIERNKRKFKEANLEFHCLDIAADNLPPGDCALVRQVLQHLSNEEVKKVVRKLSGYKYVILTEHIPEGEFIPNLDIVTGQGIRLKKQSGINLLAEPFNFKVTSTKELISIKVKSYKGRVVTKLYER